MVAQNKKTEELCCFYVSDFHLEMILLPYINKKIEEQENIYITTENNLKSSLKILIERVNLKDEIKEKILNLNWDVQKNEEEMNLIKENISNIIIIGSENFINQKNKQINKEKYKNIINCYSFDEVKDDMDRIIKKHNDVLNNK